MMPCDSTPSFWPLSIRFSSYFLRCVSHKASPQLSVAKSYLENQNAANEIVT